MNITPVGIAVAVAVVIALAFLFFGPSILMPFTPATQTASSTGTAALSTQNAAPQASGSSTPTSLQITDLKVGTGTEAKVGDTVTVEYVGALQNGTVFDSTQAHGQPFTFQLGAGQVIPGWDQGIMGMKVGGQRVLVIPSSLGYGSQPITNPKTGATVIPANSTLIFEVQLDNVQTTPAQ